MIIFIFILVILIGFSLLLLKSFASDNFPYVQFYTRGKESGFAFSEINMLHRTALENNLKNPLALFWSVKQLDRCLQSMIIKRRNGTTTKINDELISKLFDFRKKVEFDLPKYRTGITTSRKIAVRQILKITLPGVGVYVSNVVENLRNYFAISYPIGQKLPVGTLWSGRKVNIYFWREDDAGYVFETRILSDYTGSKVPILHVGHSDSLIRSQKRRSIRANLNKKANLYSVRTTADANEVIDKSPGIRCILRDISEDGASIVIGGKAKAGITVKLQATFARDIVVMCGIVRGVNFSQSKNQSVLHIKAVPPSNNMKNKILTAVYNLFPDK